jgi:hypothetical protein
VVNVLSKLNESKTSFSLYTRAVLILSAHLPVGLPGLSEFFDKISCDLAKSHAYYMPRTSHHFLFEAQQPNSGLGHLIVEVSRSHTHTQRIVFL